MITVKSSNAGLRDKIRRWVSRRPIARAEALKLVVRDVGMEAFKVAPKDTNRYSRANAQAANDIIGAGRIPVAPLRASRVHEEIVRKLKKQVRMWEFIVASMEERQRTHYGHRKFKKDGAINQAGETKSYRKAKRNLEKAQEQLARVDKTSIAFGLRGRLTKNGQAAVNVTVREKVYGGSGEIFQSGDLTVAKMHNREAHATIIESKYKVMKIAMATARARQRGTRAIGRAYLNRIEAARN